MTMADAFDLAGAELKLLYSEGIPGAELRRRAQELSGHEWESLLPSDFCYNRTNRGIRRPPLNNPVFLWQPGGLYRYVGRGYAYDGPVAGATKGEAKQSAFITTRRDALPTSAQGMADSPWFSIWQNKRWPYSELQEGSDLYWFDSHRRSVLWKSRVTRVDAFPYESKVALRRRLEEFFVGKDVSHRYLDAAAEQGYCVAFAVGQLRRRQVARPAGYEFPQLGWVRLADDASREWVPLLEADPDGSATPDLESEAAAAASSGYFSPPTPAEERERRLREVAVRRGQHEFRERLLGAYEGRCAVTGCDALAALEAAHILPYCDGGTDQASNGLLLRADIHTLFDLDLIGIDPETRQLSLAPVICGTSYAELDGKTLLVPAESSGRPASQSLLSRWERFRAQFD